MFGAPEWPQPKNYEKWEDWADQLIQLLNTEWVDDYSEVGQYAEFAVSLPPNGKWLPTVGGSFLDASFPVLAQKLQTTFGAKPTADSTRLPNRAAGAANFVGGIRAT
jgi:hypothetical protein